MRNTDAGDRFVLVNRGVSMLVMSRERDQSILVQGPEGGFLVTVLQVGYVDASIVRDGNPWALE
jgi:hypothetical protein